MTCFQVASRQRGVSVIEMLVALVLGLVLLGGVLGIYLSSRQTFQTHENLARLQENARLAFDLMVSEVRDAGLIHCGTQLRANVLAPAAGPIPWWANTDAGMVRGGEGSSQGVVVTGNDDAQHVNETDTLLILRSSGDDEGLSEVISHDVVTNTFTVRQAAPFAERRPVVVCDGDSSALLQLSAVVDNAPSQQLGYGGAPLNCSNFLGLVGPQCNAASNKTFTAGAIVARWEPVYWFIGNSDNGNTRSLYRVRIDRAAVGAVSPAFINETREMIRDVQDMQIDYLTRDRTNGGMLANDWVTAAAFNGQWSQPAFEVAAIRIRLTLRSAGRAGAQGGALERQLVAVAALRNRN